MKIIILVCIVGLTLIGFIALLIEGIEMIIKINRKLKK